MWSFSMLCARRRTPATRPWNRRLDSWHRMQPRRAFFTHMSHDLLHAETNNELPEHIQLAYDGLRIPFEI